MTPHRFAVSLSISSVILCAPVRSQTTALVSADSFGVPGNGHSYYPSISSDGRFVVFPSLASNLVPGDSNAAWDVFVHDRRTGATTRVSVASDGTQANGDALLNHAPRTAVSADGRFVAFSSVASNLVVGDTNGASDVFVHDRRTGTTTCVSVGSAGVLGNGDSTSPSISADGRFVVFVSAASNLVAGDTNGTWDVFLHDRLTHQTRRISLDSLGAQADADSFAPALSADGRSIAFQSSASNLVLGDTNGLSDVFVRDLSTGVTKRVSVSSTGAEGIGGIKGSNSPAISADGRYVAFESEDTNLVDDDVNDWSDVFVHDLVSGQTARVSVDPHGTQTRNAGGLLGTGFPSISADGRYVAFHSTATNLVPDDPSGNFDIFVHDRETGITTRESVDSAGAPGNASSMWPALSADGRVVVFQSNATNLVRADNPRTIDVFVHER